MPVETVAQTVLDLATQSTPAAVEATLDVEPSPAQPWESVVESQPFDPAPAEPPQPPAEADTFAPQPPAAAWTPTPEQNQWLQVETVPAGQDEQAPAEHDKDTQPG